MFVFALAAYNLIDKTHACDNCTDALSMHVSVCARWEMSSRGMMGRRSRRENS